MKANELIVGETYVLDVGFANSSNVKVVMVYGKYFCRVQSIDDGEEWDTMCYRLSPITSLKPN